MNSLNPILNINDAALMDFASPKETFKAKLGRMGPTLCLEKLGAMLTIIEPGKRAFPYHRHHAIEELFFIIEGAGEYRYGDDVYPIKPGDLLSAPVGEEAKAHQIINTGTEPLKFLAVSTRDPVDIVEYPDAEKFRAYSAGKTPALEHARFHQLARNENTVELFEGME